jgi:hypothetical protein
MPRDRVYLMAHVGPELRDAVRAEAKRLGEPFSDVVSRLLLISMLQLGLVRADAKRPRKGVRHHG